MNTKSKVEILSDCIKSVIESANARKKRIRKLDFSHLCYVKLVAISQNYGIKIATSHLDLNVSSQAVDNMSKIYGSEFAKELKTKIISLFPKQNRRFLGVDASRVCINKQICQKETGFKLTKSKSYTTAMLTSVYDVNNKLPIALNLTGHHNERNGFRDCLSHLSKGDCLIFDRGYYSKQLAQELLNLELDFIFRMKEHSSVIKKPLQGTKVVSYIIGTQQYYLLTSLKSYPEKKLQDLYHQRWAVEEWFKYLKKQLGGDFYGHTTLRRVLETLDWQHITTAIYAYLETLAPKLNNKGVLSHGTKIANCLAFCDKYTLVNLLKILAVRLSTKYRPDRHFERKSITDGGKWYRGKGVK